jgi:hypothetical protein
MSRFDNGRSRQVKVAAHGARGAVHRARFGYPGTEPADGRNPIRRYGSIGAALVAIIVCINNSLEVGAALALVSFVLGAPRSWTWVNDRLSSLTWSLGAGILVAGEILYIAGGNSERESLSGKSAGAAAILISLSAVVALASYLRRWGTSGNIASTAIGLRKRDPAAIAAVQRRAEREGYRPTDADD